MAAPREGWRKRRDEPYGGLSEQLTVSAVCGILTLVLNTDCGPPAAVALHSCPVPDSTRGSRPYEMGRDPFPHLRGSWGWSGVDLLRLGPRLESREPREPAGEVPVTLAQQLHGGWEKNAADEGGVYQDRCRQANAELFEHQHREGCEDREHRDHHDRGAGHHSGG